MRQEDTVFLATTQEQSYARAGEGLLESYPKSLSMSTDELAAFLSKKRYAVLATTRPDGRAHASPIGFTFWRRAFWIASVQGARVNNLKVHPWASIVISDGEPRNEHRAVVAEGPVNLHEASKMETILQELLGPWQEKHGHQLDWAAAFIELSPRSFSHLTGQKRSTLLSRHNN